MPQEESAFERVEEGTENKLYNVFIHFSSGRKDKEEVSQKVASQIYTSISELSEWTGSFFINGKLYNMAMIEMIDIKEVTLPENKTLLG